MEGFIHSTESFGTVDGPGIRFVIFFQGCPMRCLYCHNPDTWKIGTGTKRTVESLLAEYDSVKEFMKNGGITCTGGEPLVQIGFVTELFEKAKEKEIHTCLDSSGITFTPDSTEKFERLCKCTDLVMPIWIRHVVVPGITDKEEYLFRLGEFISQLKTLKALDVLPYHTMGKVKYEQLGLDYPLGDTPPLDKEDAVKARDVIMGGLKAALKKRK